MAETIFAKGIITKDSKFGTKLSIKTDEFIEFLDTYRDNGWLNLELLTSKEGKKYIKLDTWKPDSSKKKSDDEIDMSDIPF